MKKTLESFVVLHASPGDEKYYYIDQGSTGGDGMSLSSQCEDLERSTVYGIYFSDAHDRWAEEFLALPGKYAEEGWDGYEARPLEKRSFEYASLFLGCIDARIPLPQMIVDPSGNVCFEWYKSRNDRLTITFSKNDVCYALFVCRGRRILCSTTSKFEIAHATEKLLGWRND